MAAQAHLKNEFTEDETYHNLLRWLILLLFLLVSEEGCELWLWHSLEIFSLFSSMLGNSVNIILPRELSDCENSVAYSNAVNQQIIILYYNDPKFSYGDLRANLVDPIRSSLIRVYTVCFSVRIHWMQYSMVKLHSSNFRITTAILIVYCINFSKFISIWKIKLGSKYDLLNTPPRPRPRPLPRNLKCKQMYWSKYLQRVEKIQWKL